MNFKTVLPFTISLLVSLLVSILGLFTSPAAEANEKFELEGQAFTLLEQTTVDSILGTLARSNLDAKAKAAAIKAALDNDAANGFCAKTIEIYQRPMDRPTAEKLQSACTAAFDDPQTADAIVAGDFTKPQDPSEPKLSVRERISMAISGYVYILAMGGF